MSIDKGWSESQSVEGFDLHNAIDMLQVIVINLGALRLQPEIKDTYSDHILEEMTREAMSCADVVHAALRKNNRPQDRSTNRFSNRTVPANLNIDHFPL